jgi:hypothetical protein
VQRPTGNRIVLLAIITAAIALVLQLLLIAIGLGRTNPVRLLLTPLIGGLIVYYGLRGYPTWGRVRMAVMVGVFLLLFASVA